MSTPAQQRWYQANKDRLNVQSRAWAAANKERIREIARRCLLKSKFGITLEQYEEMLSAQGGVCAICHRPERAKATDSKSIRRLNVDHDHATGRIRGLLCNACNTALGKFRDSVEMLSSAIRYLQKEQK